MDEIIYLLEYIGFVQYKSYYSANWYNLEDYSILLSVDYIAIYKKGKIIYNANSNINWIEEKYNLEELFCNYLRKQKIYDLLNGRM